MEKEDFIVLEKISNAKRFDWLRIRNKVSDQIFMFKSLKLLQDLTLDSAILAREKRILEGLSIQEIPKVAQQQNPLLGQGVLYEDFGGKPLSVYRTEHSLNAESFLKIALSICDILKQLHGHSLSHKNLNPETIFYDEETKQCFITDMVLTSQTEGDYHSFQSVFYWAKDLKYISPEQTGRMNRSLDYRSDIYSLGLVFYFLLTGRHAYLTDEVNEITYCHITKTPDFELFHELAWPRQFLTIIHKMISKMPEDRYQSLVGLEADLNSCLNSLQQNLSIPDFEIAGSDLVTEFIISEKLYGRDFELSAIKNQIEKLSGNFSGIICVEGNSGTGRTSLINEVQRTLVLNRVYFVSGTYEQSKSNSPFNGISTAFRKLIRVIASEPEHKIEEFSNKLKDILGLNLPVLIDYIPELGQLTNASINKTDLSLSAIETRLTFAFKDFIRIFARPEHPLVLFLDDVQWSDESSMKLLLDIAGKIDHFLIILAYRAQDLHSGHPLLELVNQWKKIDNTLNLNLSNLLEKDVFQMVSDTLKLDHETNSTLSKLLMAKTDGNPYYLKEVFKSLYTKQLISFQAASKSWHVSKDQLKLVDLSGNVIDGLRDKIKNLPLKTLQALQVATCLGFHFDLKNIADYLNESPASVLEHLQPALSQDLILPTNENYHLVDNDQHYHARFRFQHDSFMQTVADLSDSNLIPHIHHFAALSKLNNLTELEIEEQLIEIVNHYNQAISVITDPVEKQKLLTLNLRAGVKSQASIAYKAAIHYFKQGINLLDTNSWSSHYDESYKLYYGLAQNAYQLGQVEEADQSISTLLLNITDKFDKAFVLALRSRQYTTLGKTEAAISEGVKGLALLGLSVSEDPGQMAVLKEVFVIKWKMRGKTASQLLEQAVMMDKEKKLAAKLLTEIGPAAYILGRNNLYALTSLKVVNLSLDYGNCPESSFAYTAYGAVLGEAFGDYQGSEDFGKLAVDLNYRLDNIDYRCRVIAAYGVLMFHRKHHLSGVTDWFKKGIEAGFASGDLFFMAYCVGNSVYWNSSLTLKDSLNGQANNFPLLKQINFIDALSTSIIQINTTRNFLGLTDSIYGINYQEFDEHKLEQEMQSRRYLSGLGMYNISKAEICFLYGNYKLALEYVEKADPLRKSLTGLISVTKWTFIAYLTYSQMCYDPNVSKTKKFFKKMKPLLKKMKIWKDFNPVNFDHQYFLMLAESLGHEQKLQEAILNYQKSIEAAEVNGYHYEQAIALEYYSKFLLRHHGLLAALPLLKMAQTRYLECEYLRKADLLKTEIDELVNRSKLSSLNVIGGNLNSAHVEYNLDLDSLMAASRALSGEIILDSLFNKMMKIIMMNAGSEKGIMFLLEDDKLKPMATAMGEQVKLIKNSNDLDLDYPESIVNYVSHLKEALVLNDASKLGEYTKDAYITKNKVRSVICAPVIHLSKLYGLIYLENNQMAGAFSDERLKLLNLLSSQIAISIQNAQLYAGMEEKVAQRTEELTKSYNQLKDAQSQLVHAEKMASLGELTAGIAHEIQNPLNFVNNFAEVSGELIDEMNEELKNANYEEAMEIATDLQSNLVKINHHGKRADAIVKSMLMHSRRGSGEKELCNINELCDEYLRLAYHGLRAKDKFFNSKFELIGAKDLPKISVVQQDIGRVILNLITNAFYAVNERKKQENGQYEPYVFVKTEQSDHLITISVKDNGLGIPESIKEKIFQPFFTTKPTGQGTGLGLSLAYDIVKAHGGNLKLETKVNEGTEFIIQLPKV